MSSATCSGESSSWSSLNEPMPVPIPEPLAQAGHRHEHGKVPYRLIAFLLQPAAWWGRLRVEGLELVPTRGPLLVVPNHDSQMDPVIVGVTLRRRRSLRFLARANLWTIKGL